MIDETQPGPQRVLVVGAGMVAHRLVDRLRAADRDGACSITVVGDEPWRPYDRVALTSYLSGTPAAGLELGRPLLWADPRVRLVLGDAIEAIDLDARTARAASGEVHEWEQLVLATGADAALPPIPGTDLPGVFVYRSLADVMAIEAEVEALLAAAPTGRRPRAVVLGGGLLGLEAAGAVRGLGADATIAQSAGHILSAQLDAGGGEAARLLLAERGVDVRTGSRASALAAGADGRVAAVALPDGARLEADLVIVAAGIRPRDELAAIAGIELGPRGGVRIDEACRTSAGGVWAIGDVATVDGQVWGLIAPGNEQADVVADRLLGGSRTLGPVDASAKLKLAGVEVASFGDAFGRGEGAVDVVYADPTAGVYKKLVLSDDGQTLLGGMLVGDASAYAGLRPLVGRSLGTDPAAYLLPGDGVPPAGDGLPDDAIVCSCNGVTAGALRDAVHVDGCASFAEVQGCTGAGAACGSCVPLATKLVGAELERAGIEVSRAMCEHFELSRRELLDAVRISGARTFSEILQRHGTGGRGCDICRPAIASVLAFVAGGHVLDGERASLQDTNDHVMANMQKDGTYSVVPRMPAGEVTPDGLIAVGQVAKEFGLYTKITGGQRIDMFGARIEQLPSIWAKLIDAGFESGQAYGKALRNVKSCVGSTWCRYGVQDSVGMAVLLELRFRGLRSPHKLKFGVSGCARECAEARGKDVGVIATERGWNMYVGGNGGFTPRHAELLAEDLDDDALVRAIDRYIVYYIRTAERLQRTARWIEELEGGIEGLRRVIFEDSLGIADELDATMRDHVDAYRDEWRATLEDPERLQRFVSFVNAPDAPDPDLAYVPERGQHRPASAEERASGAPLARSGLEIHA
ncbi:nitrite reductase large subunit NirB [Agrococcus sediminis]|uniref:nitrite reductase large subunit NirB n=1 Tax=Agrococcus TaxID=46352 RepID=UPI002857B326|nr:nitrite reductase large subunit NirB [Agrococcus sp. BE272]MDR7233739.1 nitrite reductase (NADH) large subunit [Agrococcus sp. BE272]